MSLFVGNLSKNVRSDELKKEFEKYGPCTTTNKGSFAFVDFDNEEDAAKAKTELIDKDMRGLKINIEWGKKDRRFDPENSNRPPAKRREKRDRDDVQCFNCDKRGHYARDCKSSKKRRSSRDRYDRRSRSPRRDDRRRSRSPRDDRRYDRDDRRYRDRDYNRSRDDRRGGDRRRDRSRDDWDRRRDDSRDRRPRDRDVSRGRDDSRGRPDDRQRADSRGKADRYSRDDSYKRGGSRSRDEKKNFRSKSRNSDRRSERRSAGSYKARDEKSPHRSHHDDKVSERRGPSSHRGEVDHFDQKSEKAQDKVENGQTENAEYV